MQKLNYSNCSDKWRAIASNIDSYILNVIQYQNCDYYYYANYKNAKISGFHLTRAAGRLKKQCQLINISQTSKKGVEVK